MHTEKTSEIGQEFSYNIPLSINHCMCIKNFVEVEDYLEGLMVIVFDDHIRSGIASVLTSQKGQPNLIIYGSLSIVHK